ncbi:MAG: hypothetical protein HWE20_14265 [Gammaproteobacteria bacterium]|nr:hypothetical protein [Gammaproteobacteria bacterium]
MQTKQPSEQQLADWIEQVHNYLLSPWTLIWRNFVAGVFRGLGAAVGATLVLSLLVWAIAKMASLPLVGEYLGGMKEQLTAYAEKTNYTDEFERLEAELVRLNEVVQGGRDLQ